MKVFICSSSAEFGDYRKEIWDKPETWWGSDAPPKFRSMLDAKAAPIPPVDWSIREAAQSDAVILLLGDAHGSLAKEPDSANSGVDTELLRGLILHDEGWSSVEAPEKFSYTQWEVLSALAADVPVYVFCPDRNSRDLPAKSVEAEPEHLRIRQQRFREWLLRHKCTEDHFGSNLDLINKVREAMRRRQDELAKGARRQRRSRRFLLAGGLLGSMALVLFLFPISFDNRPAADRRARWAFALGVSLAVLGQSSTASGEQPFEEALRELDFADDRARSLREDYATLDSAVASGEVSYAEALPALQRKVLTDLGNKYGETIVRRASLGYDVAYLRLLVEHWELWDAQRSTEAESAVQRLQSGAKQANLSQEQLQLIMAIELARFESHMDRIDVLSDLDHLVQLHDPVGVSRGRW